MQKPNRIKYQLSLEIVRLKKDISEGGAANRGVYLADVKIKGQLVEDVLVKITDSASSWWFFRVNAVSCLGLGTRYLGWTKSEGYNALVMTHVPGVSSKNRMYSKYFNHHTLRRMEELFLLLLKYNVCFIQLEGLVDEYGEMHLIDYDTNRYKERWTSEDIREVQQCIDRDIDYLKTVLDLKLHLRLEEMEKQVKWFIDEKLQLPEDVFRRLVDERIVSLYSDRVAKDVEKSSIATTLSIFLKTKKKTERSL